MHRTPLLLGIALAVWGIPASAQSRARELGIPIGGTPGPLDAITDVAGVEVGHTTIVSGSGPLLVGQGPVRTGVTVVHPRGRHSVDPVFGAWFTLNGNGEMTGTTWLTEGGFIEDRIAITNTHSVGVVRDAIIQWQVRQPGAQPWALPVVAETWDGDLNDANGFHVRPEHVFAALDGALGGPVAEGNVGGGTGMVCHRFKGGIGTASRRLSPQEGGWTVGVLVQCNYGSREALQVAGVPVGEEIRDLMPCVASTRVPTTGSIRMGGRGGNSSGDIFVAFSTANPGIAYDATLSTARFIPNDLLNPLFTATIQATEAAILNAMLAAETMTGANDVRVFALPHDRLLAAMRKYGRLR